MHAGAKTAFQGLGRRLRQMVNCFLLVTKLLSLHLQILSWSDHTELQGSQVVKVGTQSRWAPFYTTEKPLCTLLTFKTGWLDTNTLSTAVPSTHCPTELYLCVTWQSVTLVAILETGLAAPECGHS